MSAIISSINGIPLIKFHQLSPINQIVFNLAIITSISRSIRTFMILKISLSSFYGIDKFISPRLITFTACEIFYYWDKTNHSVYLLMIISVYCVNELITLTIRLFSNEIILTIRVISRYNFSNKTQLFWLFESRWP